MFVPLGIQHPYERTPYATWALVGLNTAIWLVTLFTGRASLAGLALDPEAFQAHQLITSAFLHLGFFHILFNMIFLLVFGRYVEERLGPAKMLGLYSVTELVADLAYLASGARAPSVGASGAISGLMGFVLAAAPWVEIRVVFVLNAYVNTSFTMAVLWMLVPWVLGQLLAAPQAASTGVAIAAHLGGFGAGAAIGALLRSARCKGTHWYVDPAPPGGGQAAVNRLQRARGTVRKGPP